MKTIFVALILCACSPSVFAKSLINLYSQDGLVFSNLATADLVDESLKINNDITKTKTTLLLETNSITIDSELFKYKLKVVERELGHIEEGSTFQCVNYKTNEEATVILMPFLKDDKIFTVLYIPKEGEILVFMNFY